MGQTYMPTPAVREGKNRLVKEVSSMQSWFPKRSVLLVFLFLKAFKLEKKVELENKKEVWGSERWNREEKANVGMGGK